ncbi:MAG: hypothetical protein GXO01_03710, partial [Epsilonproteobacteria bacterium]|nr:hypothetical protein [Campylobacterota bacterium]
FIIEKLLDEKNDFFKDIEEFLEKANQKMKLTKTQYEELKKIIVYYKIKQKPFPKIPILKNKKEVSEFLNSLTS